MEVEEHSVLVKSLFFSKEALGLAFVARDALSKPSPRSSLMLCLSILEVSRLVLLVLANASSVSPSFAEVMVLFVGFCCSELFCFCRLFACVWCLTCCVCWLKPSCCCYY